jgi:DnaJ-class molecular chaperone
MSAKKPGSSTKRGAAAGARAPEEDAVGGGASASRRDVGDVGGVKTHYQTLGVSRLASAAEIKRAFHALARRTHPDVNPSPEATAAFAAVQAAYEALSDAGRRSAYDRALMAAEARARGESDGEAVGTMHFRWTNVADPKARTHRVDDELFEELYASFFATREEFGPAGKARRERGK